MSATDLVIRGGRVVDVDGGPEQVDLAIADGHIVDRAPRLATGVAVDTVDADGMTIVPGIVDPHVHLSSAFGCAHGHRLLAAAGVTTAIDFAGPVDDVLDTVATRGAGLLIGSLEAVPPGSAEHDLPWFVEDALAAGALGVKVLGGHFPLQPDSITTLAGLATARRDFLLAVHAGSTRTRGNFDGLCEAVDLLGDAPAYLAHLNSYVRGERHTDDRETSAAIDLLREHPTLRTECYLGTLNGCPAEVTDDALRSAATARHLHRLGYTGDAAGLAAAIADGHAGVVDPTGQLAYRDQGLRVWREAATRTMVCLPVNRLGATLTLLAARRAEQPLVEHLCSDGGGIPRNVTLTRGLTLVDWHVLTMADLLARAVVAPAAMLGLDRGCLRPGHVADLVLVDPQYHPVVTVAGGTVVYRRGEITGRGGRILVATEQAQARATDRGLPTVRARLQLPTAPP